MRRSVFVAFLIILGIAVVLSATVAGSRDKARSGSNGSPSSVVSPASVDDGVFLVTTEGQAVARLETSGGIEEEITFPYGGHIADAMFDTQRRIVFIQATGARQVLGIISAGSPTRLFPITANHKAVKVVESNTEFWVWTEDGYSIPVFLGGYPIGIEQQDVDKRRGWLLVRSN